MTNNIVSFSGGKDSTAMLLMMLERGESVHSAVFFDTGWEFPQMLDHIKKIKGCVWDRYKCKVWTIHPRVPFEYWMLHRPVIGRKGNRKGKLFGVGAGWPSKSRRWCTGRKTEALDYFAKPISGAVQCIGYAKGESNRMKEGTKIPQRYPLIEYGVTESKALEYCLDKGFDWGGLYDLFDRVSCFCCPLQKNGSLRIVRREFPVLWNKMLYWDSIRPAHNIGFKGKKSVFDFERRFDLEDRQMTMFEGAV